MALYIRRPRLDEERIGRGMPSAVLGANKTALVQQASVLLYTFIFFSKWLILLTKTHSTRISIRVDVWKKVQESKWRPYFDTFSNPRLLWPCSRQIKVDPDISSDYEN